MHSLSSTEPQHGQDNKIAKRKKTKKTNKTLHRKQTASKTGVELRFPEKGKQFLLH
jgi:hypothetical protein